jgi:hypothetical protein
MCGALTMQFFSDATILRLNGCLQESPDTAVRNFSPPMPNERDCTLIDQFKVERHAFRLAGFGRLHQQK